MFVDEKDVWFFTLLCTTLFAFGIIVGIIIAIDEQKTLREELISIGCGEYDRKTGEFILINNQNVNTK